MNLTKEWYHNELARSEVDTTHRPMEEEYSFYQAVKSGNLDEIRRNCEQNTFGNQNGMGLLSNDPLVNIKYHFVITVAMITRHCVEGSMPLEQSYRLSDFYIQKLDHCHSVDEVIHLHTEMVLDFTTKMHHLKKETILSKPITLCTDYIYNHIHERITIECLADYTQLSTSYLSKLFKKEVGVSISDYIREKKIDNAKNLLRYSNYSLIEISNYLAFSSQSHFIQTFERYVGVTPKKYRDQFFRSAW